MCQELTTKCKKYNSDYLIKPGQTPILLKNTTAIVFGNLSLECTDLIIAWMDNINYIVDYSSKCASITPVLMFYF